MIKKNKKTVIITSIVILLPVLAGVLMWDRLPDMMATHWNMHNEADGFSSKASAVFFMPFFMLAIQWFCILMTTLDAKHKNHSDKLIKVVLWIVPVMSIASCGSMYAYALGMNLKIGAVISFALGIIFIVLGNYMPKYKQNYTIGIRLPWTLDDEENWHKTHRFAGIVWVIGGIIILATSFLANVWILLTVTIAMSIIPMIYSCMYYLKNKSK